MKARRQFWFASLSESMQAEGMSQPTEGHNQLHEIPKGTTKRFYSANGRLIVTVIRDEIGRYGRPQSEWTTEI